MRVSNLDSLSLSQTDFTAKLVDVVPPDDDWPEGLSINISDSIQRCRFREGYDAVVPMPTDGSAVKLAFELYPSAVVIGVGHRLRLDISSSNFPRFDVNDNSGSGLPGVADGADHNRSGTQGMPRFLGRSTVGLHAAGYRYSSWGRCSCGVSYGTNESMSCLATQPS